MSYKCTIHSDQHGDSERGGESISENSVQVVCDHVDTSTFEYFVDNIVKIEHYVRLVIQKDKTPRQRLECLQWKKA